jgi:hypothetical protein
MHTPISSARRLTGASSLIIPVTGAAGLMILVSACAAGVPHQPSASTPRPRHTAVAAAARQPVPTPAASTLAPTAPPTAPSAAPVAAAPAYTGPHFTTPQAAMTYLAAAYNSDDTAALHAVTGPQAFASLVTMRSSDTDLQLMSCAPRQQGDYVCSFRYSGPPRGPKASRTAMLIAAPAVNPGWYMYQFLSGCD